MVAGFLIALFLCVLACFGFCITTRSVMYKKFEEITARHEALAARVPTAQEWEVWKSTVSGTAARVGSLAGLPTVEEFQRIRSLAEQAFDIAIGAIPDSGITARKVGNLTVTTGMPTSASNT